MKYLFLMVFILLIGCEYNSHTVTENMLICDGKIYNDDNYKLFIKCKNGKNYKIIAGRHHLIIEEEK